MNKVQKAMFDDMKISRGIPFAKVGMHVNVDGKLGVIVGSNNSNNLQVQLSGFASSSNCHPHWRIKYFDDNGNVIKEYGD